MKLTIVGRILAVSAALMLAGCGGGDGGSLDPVTTTTTNTVPSANAGSAQSVATGTTVTLDGSGSSDADRDPLTYAWTLTGKPAGSGATLSDSTSAKPTFTADRDGVYVASLIVNDSKVGSAPATVSITAATANAAPIANAGSAQSVATGATVTLDGSGSSDANHDPLTYAWTLTGKPAGSGATLSDSTSAKPTFTADRDGVYVASLIVNDSKVGSAPATVSITAATANAAPIANAGSAQSVATGATVTLDGSGSSDANHDPLTYAWTLTSKPAGSVATLSSSTSSKPTFTADRDGVYVASLIVNDGKVGSAQATVSITAATANAAPIANAGSAQSVATGATVTLDGSGSSDANHDPLTYAWTLTGKPAGSGATLSDSTSAKPTFTADRDGVYVASLIVNDSKVGSAPATVSITAATANAAPIANAGSAQSVATGATVTLDGSGSSDANHDPLTYAWTLTSKPAGSVATLSSSTSSKPTFTADRDGVYVASLIVNDSKVGSAPATVSITAATANAAPIANAGSAQSVATGATVTLDGSGSSDANNDPLTYAWTLTGKPAGSGATLSDSTSAKPTFTADRDGVYVASLIVNDSKVGSAPATVSITARTIVLGFDALPTPYPTAPFNEVAISLQDSYSTLPGGLLNSLGDRIALATGTPRTLDNISIVLSSWACETGSGTTCQTTPGSTFDQPITLRVYANDSDGSTAVATITQTFKIPFRPSADLTNCPDGRYLDSVFTTTCVSGVAYKVTFDLSTLIPKVTLPGGTFAYDVSFATSAHGAAPSPADLLKIAVYQTGTTPSVGAAVAPGFLVWNGVSALAATIIPGSPAAGLMAQVGLIAP